MGLKTLFRYIFYVLLLTSCVGCSSTSDSWTSKLFHNTTAHYNGYYYARDEIKGIESQILKSQKDDYNRVLKLYPRLDTTLASSYDKQTQEAIKMASIAIQRHPNSKWVDDCYILVGKARLYSLDWGNAIQTFKYVNTKGEDENARHLAIVNLAKTFTEHEEFANAESAFDFLRKQKLNKENRKKFHLEYAHYYQIREDYDKMVRNLTDAAPLLKKKDNPGRIYFILGQVYQKLGFDAEAYNYYKKCIATNPSYETDFYARLYMAQVAEISKSRNITNARKSFKKLLKDSKNREFRDKIYYEMGLFERKQRNLDEAIENYNLALRTGSNKQVDGEAYLRLGEIYYDTLRNFELSQAYYDSAVKSLPTDYENYEKIQHRQTVLNEFVKNLKTIQWQDSLLLMAKMDTATLRKQIAAYIESQKKDEPKSKKKKRNRVDINSVDTNLNPTEGLGSNNWYFGNPSAISLGQSEFRRIWGNVQLEDNWRRSSRAVVSSESAAQTDQDSGKQGKSDKTETVIVKKDPVKEEFDRIYIQLPLTDEQKKEALSKIEDAYFKLGDIYYFDLEEKENAVKSFQVLLERFPESEYKPEVLYKLYLIFKGTDAAKADVYATTLKNEFPNSTFAKVLVNPDYLKQSGQILEQQKIMYAEAYKNYENGEYEQANALLNKAIAMEQTPFVPQMKLLQILIIGKTENVNQYQYSLDKFIKDNPGVEITDYAQKLLESSKNFLAEKERKQGVKFEEFFEGQHLFIIAYSAKDKLENRMTSAIEKFNQSNFKNLKLTVSNLSLDNNQSITLVSEFDGQDSALQYYRSFSEKAVNLPEFQNLKFNTFVITKDNFDIFYRTKGLHEYLEFFKQHYHPEAP